MKRISILSVSLLLMTAALKAAEPWRLKLTSPEEQINLNIDLYKETIEVPGLEMFGPMNGYMDGNVYRVWYVTSFDIRSDKEVIIKMGNDLGSENQKCLLRQENDSTWRLQFQGQQVVKRVKGKKLVKAPSEFMLRKVR